MKTSYAVVFIFHMEFHQIKYDNGESDHRMSWFFSTREKALDFINSPPTKFPFTLPKDQYKLKLFVEETF